ncbi:MAG: hypothetical protein WBN93_09450, partial [Acidimicrobiia bacterium]
MRNNSVWQSGNRCANPTHCARHLDHLVSKSAEGLPAAIAKASVDLALRQARGSGLIGTDSAALACRNLGHKSIRVHSDKLPRSRLNFQGSDAPAFLRADSAAYGVENPGFAAPAFLRADGAAYG